MHCLNMTSAETTISEAGSGVDDGMEDLRLVSFRYCPTMGYAVVSWVCQFWTVICCHTLGKNSQGSFVAAVFRHAI